MVASPPYDLLILCYSASFQMGPDYILSLHEANQLLVDELHTLFDYLAEISFYNEACKYKKVFGCGSPIRSL